MRYKEIIVELFDTDVVWRMRRVGDNKIIFTSNIGGRDIELEYFTNNGFRNVHVSFTVDGEYDVTGEGDAAAIFGVVINNIMRFVDRVKPDKLGFAAHKPDDIGGSTPYETRARLYDRIVRRYINGSGYSYHVEDRDGFSIYVLTRNSVDG